MSANDEQRADASPPRGSLGTAYNGLVNSLAVLAGAMIVFAMIAVTLDVVMRALFRSSLWWSFEVTEFLLVYIPLLTLPWLARRRAHIVIDIVTSRLPATSARRLDVFTSFLAFATCMFVAYWGGMATLTAYNRGIVNAGMVSYPRWALLVVIPLGFGLAAIEFARIAFQEARKDG